MAPANTARTRVTQKARRSRARSRHPSRCGEFLGMIVLAATAFLLVSLYSYDAAAGDLFIHIAGAHGVRAVGGRI